MICKLLPRKKFYLPFLRKAHDMPEKNSHGAYVLFGAVVYLSIAYITLALQIKKGA